MVKLRQYQQQCIDQIRLAVMAGEKQILVVAPCGFGKTIIFCYLAERISARDKSIIIVVDSINLVLQTKEKLRNFVNENDIDICCGSLNKKNADKKIIIGTIQTLKNMKLRSCDYLIFDEVHDGLSRIEKFAKKFNSISIGFTATPYHSDSVAIYGENKFFKKVNFRCKPKDLIQQGFLVDICYRKQLQETEIDLSGVELSHFGDFKEDQLQKTYSDNFEKVILQIEDMKKKTEGRNKIVIMTTGIAHANFVQMNLENSCLFHSQIEDKERFDNLNKFKKGEFRFLIGVSAIYKGLDVPSVDCLVMMRPTKSYPFYVQFIGRGARTSEGKTDCLFLDYGQVLKSLGFYDDIEEVKNRKEIKKIKKPQEPIECNKCGFLWKKLIEFCICGNRLKPKEDLQKVENTTLVASSDVSKKDEPFWISPTSIHVLTNQKSKAGNDMVVVKAIVGFIEYKFFYPTKFSYTLEEKAVLKSLADKNVNKILIDKKNGYYKILKIES